MRQQARCVIEAHAIAGIEPETISYVEAHGTGTSLGDPIEVAALSMAFREGTAQNQFCALGSLKSNIGHLDAAAGVAGLIKTAYALKNRTIPPTINFDTPNPEIDFAASPFRVADKLEPWVSPTGPRRAGVQSFGMGGTNAHVVLEEAPPVAESAHPDHPRFYLVSAKTSEACREAAANLADALEADPDLDLGDVAFTLDQGRRKFAFRRAVAAGSRADLIEGLKAPGRPVRVSSDAPSPGFMFSGQGAQYPGMGRGLYETEAVFRAAFDDCRTAFARHVDIDLARLVFPTAGDEEAAAEQLRQTIYTQPALFAVEYALARLWMGWGVTPQWMIGHSIGEYAAACIAGVFDLDAAAEIVATRARLMYSCDAGAMLAVSATADETRALLTSDLDVAVINTSTSTVVSGPIDAIDALAQRLAGERIPATRLQTSHAFHSQMMTPILEEFEHVGGTPYRWRRPPLHSSRTSPATGSPTRRRPARDTGPTTSANRCASLTASRPSSKTGPGPSSRSGRDEPWQPSSASTPQPLPIPPSSHPCATPASTPMTARLFVKPPPTSGRPASTWPRN